jgi:hypothetical protein
VAGIMLTTISCLAVIPSLVVPTSGCLQQLRIYVFEFGIVLSIGCNVIALFLLPWTRVKA